MKDLYQEIEDALNLFGNTWDDVLWIGSEEVEIEKEALRVKYVNGHGIQEVPWGLLVVGKDWWLERCEYDGMEGWTHKTYPARPKIMVKGANVLRDGGDLLSENLEKGAKKDA